MTELCATKDYNNLAKAASNPSINIPALYNKHNFPPLTGLLAV